MKSIMVRKKETRPDGRYIVYFPLKKITDRRYVADVVFESNEFMDISRVLQESNLDVCFGELDRMRYNVDEFIIKKEVGNRKMVYVKPGVTFDDAIPYLDDVVANPPFLEVVVKDGKIQMIVRVVKKPKSWPVESKNEEDENVKTEEYVELGKSFDGPGGVIYASIKRQEVIKCIDLSQFGLGNKWYLTRSHGYGYSKFFDTLKRARKELDIRRVESKYNGE